MRRWWVHALKLALAATLVGWIIASGRIRLEHFRMLSERWPWFVAALPVYGMVLVLAAVRWRCLLGAQGIRYGFRAPMRYTLIGLFFNQFMPGATGGDVAKAWYVATDWPGRRAAAILTVIFDRVLGLGVLVWVAGSAALAQLSFVRGDVLLDSLATVVWVGMALTAVGVFILWSDRLRTRAWVRAVSTRLPLRRVIRTLADTLSIYKRYPRQVTLAILISVGIHSGVVVCHAFLMRAVSSDPVPLAQLFVVVPLSQIAMAIPLTPGSLGTAEAAYGELFRSLGSSDGAFVCILLRLTFFAWGALGCGVYLLSRRRPPAETFAEPGDGADATLVSDGSRGGGGAAPMSH